MTRTTRITERAIGRFRDLELVAYELESSLLRVIVWNYGATVAGVWLKGIDGKERLLTITPPHPQSSGDSVRRNYIGSTMGRFARIVQDATVLIEGEEVRLSRNEGNHHLHGGESGFDDKFWMGEIASDSGEVVLTYRSPSGEEGYPGHLTATASFSLQEADRLVIHYRATADSPTLCGFTSHVFWNLGDSTIDDHQLSLDADGILDASPDFLPLGTVTPLDKWSDSGSLSLAERAIDSCFVAAHGHASATLTHIESGTRLELASNQDALAIYTGDGLPVQRQGICLQAGPAPIGADHRSDAILAPGHAYSNLTSFRISDAES